MAFIFTQLLHTSHIFRTFAVCFRIAGSSRKRARSSSKLARSSMKKARRSFKKAGRSPINTKMEELKD